MAVDPNLVANTALSFQPSWVFEFLKFASPFVALFIFYLGLAFAPFIEVRKNSVKEKKDREILNNELNFEVETLAYFIKCLIDAIHYQTSILENSKGVDLLIKQYIKQEKVSKFRPGQIEIIFLEDVLKNSYSQINFVKRAALKKVQFVLKNYNAYIEKTKENEEKEKPSEEEFINVMKTYLLLCLTLRFYIKNYLEGKVPTVDVINKTNTTDYIVGCQAKDLSLEIPEEYIYIKRKETFKYNIGLDGLEDFYKEE